MSSVRARRSLASDVFAAFFPKRPDTKITKSKIDRKHHRAKFKFKAVGLTDHFECSLVKLPKKNPPPKPVFTKCKSPASYTNLGPGRYRFFVRARGSRDHGTRPLAGEEELQDRAFVARLGS